jgi:hypothetical protein
MNDIDDASTVMDIFRRHAFDGHSDVTTASVEIVLAIWNLGFSGNKGYTIFKSQVCYTSCRGFLSFSTWNLQKNGGTSPIRHILVEH